MGSRVPTNEEWIERASTIHSNKYDYSKTKYTGAAYKVTIICPIHGEFNQRASQHLRGEGCPKCGIERRADVQRVDVSQFIAAAKEVHCNEYDYSKVVYVNTHTKVIITCPTHGDFRMTPSAHVNSKQGCPKCAGKNRSLPELIDRFKQVHGDRYDYSHVDTTRVYDVVTIMCPDHGPYTQSIKHHLRGLGCSKCSGVYSPTTMEWIERAREQWGGERYDYSQVEYKDTHTPVTIKCVEHNHVFKQSPLQHLKSMGCAVCTQKEQDARYHTKWQIRDDDESTKLADWDWIKQQNELGRSATEIAAELNVWPATVRLRFEKNNVEYIKRAQSVSAAERQIRSIVESLNIEYVSNDRSVLGGKELDIWIPSRNLAIEYCGLYWHSESFRDRGYHLDKLERCASLGIRLLTIFEDEWVNHENIVRRKIEHILGHSNISSVSARACTVVPVSSSDKRQFMDKYHIQGMGPGSITFGLSHRDELVAVMSFIAKDGGEYELSRYATSQPVNGGFSRLLTHFKRTHDWTSITSFADRRWSTGGVYETTGFELCGIIPPTYHIWCGTKRYHRSNFTRDKLSRLMGDAYNPNETIEHNLARSKYKRIWDCGLLKYSMKRDS